MSTFDESSMWQFAEKYGPFTLEFGEKDERGLWIDPAELRRPDAMPWTLVFTKESGETAEWEHRFAGYYLSDLSSGPQISSMARWTGTSDPTTATT